MKANGTMMNTKQIILSDILTFLFSTTVVFISWGGALWYACEIFQAKYYFFLVLTPFIASFLLILSLFIVRIFIPKMKPGVYTAGLNKGFLSWYLNLIINRAIRISQLQEFIYTFYFLKYFYWKAMGANISFGINSSMYVNFVDLPLISIGKGSTIADNVRISCHTFTGNRLLLSPVIIGNNSFIGMDSTIAANVKIGNNCWIGIGNNLIARQKIKDNMKIENFALSEGKMKD